MAGWLIGLANLILQLLGRRPPPPKPEERAGRAEARADSERASREELERMAAAGRNADLGRVRDAPAVVTTDRNAPVNADDGFRID